MNEPTIPQSNLQKRALLRGLYVVTDARATGGHLAMSRAALAGGANVIQLRDKTASARELLGIAHQIRQLTRAQNALFLINDRADIALACDADGVHLGPDDVPPSFARQIIGPHRLLGLSCGSEEEARAAYASGADYIGAGAVFNTQTKPDAGEAIGVAALGNIVRATPLPVAAVGGVSRDNLRQVVEAGARMACVVSAISQASDEAGMQAATRELVTLTNSYALLYGDLQTEMELPALRDALAGTGILARLGEPNARKNATNLRAYRDDATLTFEKTGAREYTVSGEAPTIGSLSAWAETVSDALRELRLPHRFEVYAPDSDELAAHFQLD